MHLLKFLARHLVLAVAAVILVGLSSHASGAGRTYFAFTSTANSYVGQGYPYYLATPGMGWTFDAYSTANGTRIHLSARRSPDPHLDNYYWTIDLESAFNATLAPGLYEGARRWPFNDSQEPGLNLSGNHRGLNALSGYFRILELQHNRFAVDFRQYEGPDKWVDGQFQYNATIPEPSSFCMVVIVGCVAVYASRRVA